MAYSVFISYSTRDLATAQGLQAWVLNAGAAAFVAEYSVSPGGQLANEIASAIKGCDLFLLLWSSNAQGSDWVPQEIGMAKAGQKAILPVVLHEGITLPGFIQDLKYLPLYKDAQAAVQWLRDQVAIQVKRKKDAEGLAVAVILGGIIAPLLGGSGSS